MWSSVGWLPLLFTLNHLAEPGPQTCCPQAEKSISVDDSVPMINYEVSFQAGEGALHLNDKLSVRVISARNLPAMGTTGTCNPRVEVELLHPTRTEVSFVLLRSGEPCGQGADVPCWGVVPLD